MAVLLTGLQTSRTPNTALKGRNDMPHIVAKVRAGYSKRLKVRLARALARTIVEILDCPNFDVSVGIEDVRSSEWSERVYRPDILAKTNTIFQKPGDASLAD